MRRPAILLTLVLGVLVSTVGPAGADHEYRYEPITTKYYMRNDGGGCSGTPFLSTELETGEPGCGYVGGAPFGELYHAGVWGTSTIKTYATRTAVTEYLDPSRDVTGNVRVVATATTNRMAIGQIRVDVTLRATTKGGQTLTLGSHSSEVLVNPTNSSEVDFPFTMDLDGLASLDKTEISGLSIDVDIRGFHALTGYHRLDGQSWFDLPSYEKIPIPHEEEIPAP